MTNIDLVIFDERSGTHHSKTKSTSYEVLFVLRRVDKKDACSLFYHLMLIIVLAKKIHCSAQLVEIYERTDEDKGTEHVPAS